MKKFLSGLGAWLFVLTAGWGATVLALLFFRLAWVAAGLWVPRV